MLSTEDSNIHIAIVGNTSIINADPTNAVYTEDSNIHIAIVANTSIINTDPTNAVY